MLNLKINNIAPFFSAQNQHGKTVSLLDYKGSKLILFFYPRDNTQTCTIEACNLRDNYKILTDKGFKLLGISNDPPKSHQKFIKKFDLPFDLLADEDKQIVNAYGVYGEKKFMGRIIVGIYRTTFVIDENSIITGIISDVKSKNHAQQILSTLHLG